MSGTNQKRLVLLIVEGFSDELLLMDRLRERFQKFQIRFRPYGGDIFYSLTDKKTPIKSAVGDFVNEFLKKNKLLKKDILTIFHILDTDGVFVDSTHIQVVSDQSEMTLYSKDEIRVKSEEQKDRIDVRNSDRSTKIKTMSSIDTVAGISYQLYFFSRCLEHVIFDEMNPDKHTKVDEVEDFLDELMIPIEDYLEKYIPAGTLHNSYKETYEATWSYIENDACSLERNTNTMLMFQFLQELIEE